MKMISIRQVIHNNYNFIYRIGTWFEERGNKLDKLEFFEALKNRLQLN